LTSAASTGSLVVAVDGLIAETAGADRPDSEARHRYRVGEAEYGLCLLDCLRI